MMLSKNTTIVHIKNESDSSENSGSTPSAVEFSKAFDELAKFLLNEYRKKKKSERSESPGNN